MKTFYSLRFFFSITLLFATQQIGSAQNNTISDDSLFVQAKALFNAGNYKQAKTVHETVLKNRIAEFGEENEKVIHSYYELGRAEQQLVFYEAALQNFEKAQALAEPLLGKEHELVGDLYLELVNMHELMYAPEKAIPIAQKAIQLFDELHGTPYLKTGTLEMIVGVCYTNKGQFDDAEKYLLRALAIFQKTTEPKSFYMVRVYSNLGRVYRKMNDFDKALDYCQKAFDASLILYGKDHPSLAQYYYNLAKVYSWKGEHQEALVYMKKTLEIDRKTIGEDHPSTGGTYGELAGVYADLGEYDRALPLYFKAMDILEKRLSLDHPAVIAGYNNIALLYEETEQHEKALDFFRLSINKYRKNPNTRFLRSDTYRSMAETFKKQGKVDSVFLYLGLGIESITPEFNYEYGKNTLYPALERVQANVPYINLLRVKSKAFEQVYTEDKDKDQSNLKAALQSLEIAIKVIEKVRRGYESDGSRTTLNENVSDIFEEAIRLSFDLYDQTEDMEYLLKAFRFSEKSKASILWQHMNENFALVNAGIPESSLTKLTKLGEAINELEESLYDSKDRIDPIKKEKYFNLKLEYEQAVADLEKYNPDYYQLRYASPSIELEGLMAKLPDDQTLLVEYFHDEQNLYIFTVSKNGLKAFRHAFSEKSRKAINAIKNFDIQSYFNKQDENNEEYIANLNGLYESLIQPIQNELADKNQMIIVQHGLLNYLPFGMLAPQSTNTDFRALPYLIKTQTIQYAHSLAIWKKTDPTEKHFEQELTGFAPFSGVPGFNQKSLPQIAFRSDLSALQFSKTELEKANEYFSGSTFYHEMATEQTFQQNAHKGKIIHLATHAIANDENPMRSGLVFSNKIDTIEDGFLNVYEIYNMRLPAELAVMSACDTGLGQLAEGEGVISLGRAFSYAGCKSVLMSLWKANDSSTASMMSNFYQLLAKGQKKDEALKQAKLDYLANSDPLMAHPYFWAGMVAKGDMSALSQSRGFSWKMLAASFTVLMLVFLLFSRVRSN